MKPIALARRTVLFLALLLAACGPQPEPKAPPAPEQKVEVPEPLPAPELEPAPAPPPDRLLLTPVDFAALPGWRADTLAEAAKALARSCRRLAKQPDSRQLGPEGLAGKVADWRAPCDALAGADDTALHDVFESWFRPFEASNNGDPEGLFTGYYEAELTGSRSPQGPRATPLYRAPPDMVRVDLGLFRADLKGERLVGRVEKGRLVPYLTRAEIDGGALAGKGLELIWADDPVDAFFLHVQGSGQVVLPDGERVRVGYAASNGHKFYAIGRALIDEGVISREKVSMQAIRDWLRANPEEARAMMQRNARYIFFGEVTGAGPIGAQGVALTAGRSLAVDPAFLPLGIPLYLDTTWPASDRPLRRLMVTQDTGSAIKGPVRGDFYWGSGDAALAEAGRMKQKGRYYLFLPKTVAERRERGS